MLKSSIAIAAAGAVSLIVQGRAHADTVVYTDSSAFATATSSSTAVQFPASPAGGFTFSGVTFVVQPDQTASENAGGYTDSPNAGFEPNLYFDLPTGVTALGVTFSDTKAKDLTFKLSDGTMTTLTAPSGGGSAFVGFTSSAPITGARIYIPFSGDFAKVSGDHITVSGLTYGTAADPIASAAPLPSAAWAGMTLLGGCGLLNLHRRRTKVA